MEGALVSAATGALTAVLGKLVTLLGDEYKHLKGVRHDIRFLTNELIPMHAFLLKMSEEEDPNVQGKAWMTEVRELSYDLEDSIDDFMQRVDDKDAKPEGFLEKIKHSLGELGEMTTRHGIGKEIQDLQQQIIEVGERNARYKTRAVFSKTINATSGPSSEMGYLASELEALERILSDASAPPTKLSYALVKSITNNFSKVIGCGGCAVVYQGVLRNGKVAVKKLSISNGFSDDLFVDEIECLKRAKHNNIVRYLGYCADTRGEVMNFNGKRVIAEVPKRLLCFEYVPNGSLHRYLKEKPRGDEWQISYQMINGICQGLQFLHKTRINHLDLKPGNILLDAHLEPKIADFGLSRCFDEGQSRIFTIHISGTPGYIAPEIINNGEISFKSDIFALGVIIIKILTWRNDCDMENWHKSLNIDCPRVRNCVEIAQACVDDDQHNRPTIDEIIQKLNELETTNQKVSLVVH